MPILRKHVAHGLVALSLAVQFSSAARLQDLAEHMGQLLTLDGFPGSSVSEQLHRGTPGAAPQDLASAPLPQQQALDESTPHLGMGAALLEQTSNSFDVAHLQRAASASGMAWIMSFLTFAFAAALVLAVVTPQLPVRAVSIVVCVVYVVFSVTIDISIAVQKTPDKAEAFSFNPACVVMLTEVCKLFASAVLYAANRMSQKWSGNISEECSASFQEVSPSDVAWLVLPAAFFTASNLLVWKAIGGNDMASFGVFRDTVILFTAAIWCLAFKTVLGRQRILGICLIFSGLALNRVAALPSGHACTWGILLVLLMAMANACASVTNEVALKRSRGLDINLQNAVLYSAGILCTLFVLCVSDPGKLSSLPSFFQGFTHGTIFTMSAQVISGLLVSRLLKYSDSVTKTVASCLRGPLVVFISPVFVASPLHFITAGSAMVVASGCFTYLVVGRLEESTGDVVKQERPSVATPPRLSVEAMKQHRRESWEQAGLTWVRSPRASGSK